MNAKVTVLIPIGPNKIYREYLPDAIQSVLNQTVTPSEILIIDDGANITDQDIHSWFEIEAAELSYRGREHWWLSDQRFGVILVTVWHSPASIGFAQAFNCGMALASNDLVMYLASDDTLGQDAVKDCVETYEANNEKDAWYSLTYESSEGISDIPINAALITRNLFNYLGGYAPAAFAGPDAALLSILLYWMSDRIVYVQRGKVNYHIKKHNYQETKITAQRFSDEMTTIRTKLTLDFKPRDGVVLK